MPKERLLIFVSTLSEWRDVSLLFSQGENKTATSLLVKVK